MKMELRQKYSFLKIRIVMRLEESYENRKSKNY